MTEQCLLIYSLFTSEMVRMRDVGAKTDDPGGSHAPWLSVVCFFWGAEIRTLKLTLGKMEQSLQIVWSLSTCLSLFSFRGSEKTGVVQSRLIRRWCGGVHTYDVSFMLVREQVLLNSLRGGGGNITNMYQLYLTTAKCRRGWGSEVEFIIIVD